MSSAENFFWTSLWGSHLCHHCYCFLDSVQDSTMCSVVLSLWSPGNCSRLLFLVFRDFVTISTIGPFFCWMHLNLGWSEIITLLNMQPSSRASQNYSSSFSMHQITAFTLIYVLIGDIHVCHLVKMIATKVFHYYVSLLMIKNRIFWIAIHKYSTHCNP